MSVQIEAAATALDEGASRQRRIFRVIEATERAALAFTVAKAGLGANKVPRSVAGFEPMPVMAAPAHSSGRDAEQKCVVRMLTADDRTCTERRITTEVGPAEHR